MQAYVYLNDGDDNWSGYVASKHADKLRLAARLTVDGGRHTLSLLDDIFTEFNIGGTYLNAEAEYRERGNRSLSVGDVVLIETNGSLTGFACASMGWEPVDVQAIRGVTA